MHLGIPVRRAKCRSIRHPWRILGHFRPFHLKGIRMKFEIKNWLSGAVIFTAEIECADDAPLSIKLGLAVKKAVEAKASLRSADLSYADLRSADLRSADLSYADLRSADLRSADLSSADLSYADLRSADLSYADLRSADLRSADLSYADLRSADLRYADLRYANLSYADLRYANLRYADLSYADLRSANLRSADLSYANLSYADLRYANLRYADLRYANLSYADLRYANLRSASSLLLSAGNNKNIKTIQTGDYIVNYTDTVMQIGYQRHSISDWWSFDDRRIADMDGKTALKFWKTWKPILQAIIEASPAEPTGYVAPVTEAAITE